MVEYFYNHLSFINCAKTTGWGRFNTTGNANVLNLIFLPAQKRKIVKFHIILIFHPSRAFTKKHDPQRVHNICSGDSKYLVFADHFCFSNVEGDFSNLTALFYKKKSI